MSPITAQPHGGDLAFATRQFGKPPAGWQDLSTGISPWSYPLGEIPPQVWQRLPDSGGELRRVAATYFGVCEAQLLPLPGSQFAIGRLPFYLPPSRVALPLLGYSEHHRAWGNAGHQIVHYRDQEQLGELVEAGAIEHLVVINPNNPGTEILTPEGLLGLYHRHRQRGLLLVDEAFADVRPGLSVAPQLETRPDLWVLRSLGKFFGLAGMRLGFLLGHSERHPVHARLEDELSPWGVSHPAQWAGIQALQDRHWHEQQRRRIERLSTALGALWQGFSERHCEGTARA